MTKVIAIAAIGKERELGIHNELLWRIPDDLKRFRSLTKGHPVIMGRKTYESIIHAIGKPLPERTSIIVTRDDTYRDRCPSEGVVCAASIREALEEAKKAKGADEIFIGGGAQIYAEALPYTDELILTTIEDTKPADSFFPEYKELFPEVVSDEIRSHERLVYHWITRTR